MSASPAVRDRRGPAGGVVPWLGIAIPGRQFIAVWQRDRDVFLRLPYFDHIHRYLPALMIREGYQNRYLPITHRARDSGRSKYTNWERLMASLSDLLGVMWLKSRSRNPGRVTEV